MEIKFINIIKECFPLSRVDDSILMANKLVGQGYKIYWFLPSCSNSKSTTFNDGSNTFYIAAKITKDCFYARLINNLANLINSFKIFALKENVDFIQAKDVYFSGLVALVFAKYKRIPFFYWLSFPFPEAQLHKAEEKTARYRVIYYLRGHLYKYIQNKMLMKSAKHIFVQSEQMKDDLTRQGINPSKMTTIPMGIDLTELPSLSVLNKEKFNPHSAVYLGSMNRVRHLDFILHAFAKVLKTIPDAILYMIGGGDEKEDLLFLKQVTSDIGISNSVIFVGQIARFDAFNLISKINVCLSPFYPSFIFNSTSPTKLVEYFALCKACVANDHPEQKKVISESGAGYCVKWDETEFAAAIVKLMLNPDMSSKMGVSGRIYIEKNREYLKISEKLARCYKENIATYDS